MQQKLQEAFLSCGIESWGVAEVRNVPLRPVKCAQHMDFSPTYALCALFPYYAGQQMGNLSLYARGEDYHQVVQRRLEQVVEKLAQFLPGVHFACFTDNSPLDEVYTAVRCGLGRRGMHQLLIHPKWGSLCFIGAILCDAPKMPVTPPMQQDPCLHCGRCVVACPTHALRMEECGQLTYHKDLCLSHITQKKQDFLLEPDGELMQKGQRVWGCDLCQLACPCNQEIPLTPFSEFREGLMCSVSREELEGLSNREFQRRYAGRAFTWRGVGVLRRNLDIVEKAHNHFDNT